MTAAPPPLAAVTRMWAGRFVRLHPLERADIPYLFDLANRDELGFRWAGDGILGNPEVFEVALGRSILAGFLVTSVAKGTAVGFVAAYDADLADGHAKLAMVADTRAGPAALSLHGAVLLTEYVFATWKFRKLYVEVPDGTSPVPIDVTIQFAREEGRLKKHLFYQGAHHDLVIYAIEGSDWETLSEPLLDQIQDLEH